jgi:hypothetical protein
VLEFFGRALGAACVAFGSGNGGLAGFSLADNEDDTCGSGESKKTCAIKRRNTSCLSIQTAPFQTQYKIAEQDTSLTLVLWP